jgi:hypothetical protein
LNDHQQFKIGGLSLGGGRKENFFISLLEFYPDKRRWFLKSLLQVKDEEIQDRDEVITNWINQYELTKLVVDFPLSKPPCESCDLVCPGLKSCPQNPVVAVRDEMNSLIEMDHQLYQANPKKYEQERNLATEVDYGRDLLSKKSEDHLLSRSFKRKLKKGFIPYWHRPIDFWIWKNYYDQSLEIFKNTYDSYGHVSMMLLARLNYLKRHFPKNLNLFESNVQITLLELYRCRLIGKFQLLQLDDLDLASVTREALIRGIEKHLSLFIYDHDFDLLVRNPKAFDSFMLAIAGQSLLKKSLRMIPPWGNADGGNFIVPSFENADQNKK